jgi:nicotinamidase-related amidase
MSNLAQEGKRALVLIGVQNEYFEGRFKLPSEMTQPVLTNIMCLIREAKVHKIPVIVVQHTAAAERAPAFAAGSRGWELHNQIKEFPFDYHFTKSSPSAFADTELCDTLKHLGVGTITLAGFVAQSGILATSVEARSLGFSAEYIRDASASLPQINSMGTATSSDIHDTLSLVIHSSFAATMDTKTWIKSLGSEKMPVRAGMWVSYDLVANAD